MNKISITLLTLTLTVFTEANAAFREDGNPPSAAVRSCTSQFTPDQEDLLKELGIPKDFDVTQTPLRTYREVELSLAQSEIMQGIRENRVCRGEDGNLYLKWCANGGIDSVTLTDWRQNPRKIAEAKQTYALSLKK